MANSNLTNAKRAQKTKKDFSEYSKDELIKELQLLKKQKKYGLVWEEHKEEVVERCKTEAPILVSKKERQIKDKDLDKPKNILIEGDNYHALQILNYTHKNKIDVIYIDPPYNTGNKDFIYNDSFVDREDNFRHSKWLSFMEKRLSLAKKLLKNDGVIFISIDDNEQAQLKLLCDEVFGESNFVGHITWESKTKSQNTKDSYSKLQPKTETMLVYFKNNKINFNLINKGKKDYNQKDKKGVFRYALVEQMDASGIRGRRTMVFDIVGLTPDTGKQWKLGLETIQKYNNRGDIVVKNNKPYIKMRPTDERTIISEPFWGFFSKEIGTAESAKKELTNLIEDHGFETVKPIALIKRIIFHATKKNGLVLDFFAGSGTTGHAVLDLNKEDGGNRKFILCTNNENKICEDITLERIKRVSKGYTKPNGKKVAGLGGALEYFKTEFVDVENIKNVSDKKKLEFTHEAGQMIALKEDSFKEVVKNKNYQIFTNEKGKYVGIYFKESLEKLSEMEKKILDKEEVKLYIFSHSENDFKNDYADYKNVRVENIPEPILKVYKSLNN